jgi:hypothetical protein
MNTTLDLLSQMGLGLASNAVYDYLKTKIFSAYDSRANVEKEIQNIITMYGCNVRASTVVSALVNNGSLVIRDSSLHGPIGLTFGSFQGSAIAGSNTRLSTDKSSFEVGPMGHFETNGNAQLRQNSDGSFHFNIGDKSGSMSWGSERAE